MVLDNQAAYRMCRENLKVKHPTFLHLNRIIAQMVSAATTSLRYPTQLNATLDEVVTNMVPETKFRYPILSLSPVRHPSRAKHENFSTKELITDLFEEKNLLADIGPGKLKQNRYLSCTILMRGFTRVSREDMKDHLSEPIDAGMEDADGKIKVPIQPRECTEAINDLMHPSGGHREPLRFLPWLGHGGFKIGAVAEPPHVPEGTAYVWQFLEANGELEMFFEAKERMHDIMPGLGLTPAAVSVDSWSSLTEMIHEYEDILYRTCEAERVTQNNLTLVGARTDFGAGGDGAGAAGA
eukprot:g8104.t1